MWYYAVNDQRTGPVDESTIIAHITDGTVHRQTLVWKEGMADWLPAVHTELQTFFAGAPPTDPYSPASMARPAYPINFQAGSLQTLWLWFAWLVGAGVPLCLVCIGIPAVIAGLVIGYILLYRYWVLIQDGNARTTPGQAVGFCFIPFFNFYWMYVAFVGLAQDMNAYCDQRRIPCPRVNEGLALSWFILSLTSIIPYLGLLIAIAAFIIQIILLKQMTDAGEQILAYKNRGSNDRTPPATSFPHPLACARGSD